jgi:SAM-dependent methyltransferase
VTDFRKQLYERYVSTFKGHTFHSQDDVQRHWEWCRRKLLPLLGHVDRRAAILELGCGPGYLLELLGREGWSNASGIDVSAEQVRLAAARGLNAVEAEALAWLSSREASYDAVIAIDFFEHFTRDELLRLTSAIHAALRPGGTLLLQTPNGAGLFPNVVIHGDLTHMTIMSPGSLGQLLRWGGFETIECFETGPVAKNLRGRVRIVLWSIIRAAASAVRRIETGGVERVWTENLLCRCRRP